LYVVHYQTPSGPVEDKVTSASKALELSQTLPKAGAWAVAVRDKAGRRISIEELASKAEAEVR
jgi:hypothetical protein